mmetsp:Transcript_58606/g.96748  ORF Transcript_58606/g.96748 Transcript_58606/m.96748 type:complete len:108 (+) Transcript_58606:266-589(+)
MRSTKLLYTCILRIIPDDTSSYAATHAGEAMCRVGFVLIGRVGKLLGQGGRQVVKIREATSEQIAVDKSPAIHMAILTMCRNMKFSMQTADRTCHFFHLAAHWRLEG